jgi:hypothetical protein
MKTSRLLKSIKTAKEWTKVHLKDPIINKETGFPIEVLPNHIDHTLGHDLFKDKSGRFVDLLSLVRKLKSILKEANLIEKRKDKYNDETDINVYVFRVSVTIKEVSEELEIIVKEKVDEKKKVINKRWFYNHKFILEEIKKP